MPPNVFLIPVTKSIPSRNFSTPSNPNAPAIQDINPFAKFKIVPTKFAMNDEKNVFNVSLIEPVSWNTAKASLKDLTKL